MTRVARCLSAVAASLALLAGAVTPASAVVWGEPDGEVHPYVVLLQMFSGNTYLGRCTGTLIAPRLVLTAGHCTVLGDNALVWQGSDLTGWNGPMTPGTTSTHPGYTWLEVNRGDVGVIILDEPVCLGQYGALPEIGVMETLVKPAQQGPPAIMNVVGYGVQEILPNPHDLVAERIREQAFPKMLGMESTAAGGWMAILQGGPGEGLGQGSACFGDSGGPALLSSGSNVIGAVASGGRTKYCTGNGFYYRVDTEYVQDWIYGSFGDLLTESPTCP